MIDRIFTFESTRVRQRAAPLLEEREAFLSHLYNSINSDRPTQIDRFDTHSDCSLYGTTINTIYRAV